MILETGQYETEKEIRKTINIKTENLPINSNW